MPSWNKKNNIAYYYCSDTSCKGCGLVRYELNTNNEYEKLKKNIEQFIITKEHSIPYIEHNYQKNKEIINDINNKTKKEIKSKLIKYSYLNTFLKSFAIINKDKISSSGELYNLFNREYGPIKLDKNYLMKI